MHTIQEKAESLTEAIPYIQKYNGKIIVIKYGGHSMDSTAVKKSILEDVALLKLLGMSPVVLHGGGPEIDKKMKKNGIKPKFLQGLRVTDKKSILIIKSVYKRINSEILSIIKNSGVQAKGLFGNDGILMARQKNKKLGFVGDVVKVNAKQILNSIKNNQIAVISPLGYANGSTYNINADTAAAAVAIALHAEKFTIMTNVKGIMENGKFYSHLDIRQVSKKIKDGVITKGMIPKVKACIDAVQKGCKKAHIIDGTMKHA
ncbi:acetylglutamate kinase, partial [Candidatus Woesearchaeota archaeon]|nr:acetylglutamate kinase [Candidatus Woesearchaeota archaeon]